MAADHAAEVEDGRGVCLATVATASFLPVKPRHAASGTTVCRRTTGRRR